MRAPQVADVASDFERFVAEVEPPLRRALTALRGQDAGDAVAEALLWAWEHWEQVQAMDNPRGYLYRVAQSRSRPRRRPALAAATDRPLTTASDVDLQRALAQLSGPQRTAVVLVHGCGWSYHELAEALGVSKSTAGTHVARGLEGLRNRLEDGNA